MRDDTADYRWLFLHDIPLMDVRAPVEFKAGAFPGALNLPLLDNQQRELIGKRFKAAGQDAAIALGMELATPALRAARLQAWQDFCDRHPDGYLYCFRGGLRSHTTQQWLRQQGVHYPLVRGGYKAMRQFLLQAFEQGFTSTPLTVLGGPTGCGKTRLLMQVTRHIDLEGIARHRGSAFGHTLQEQPSQIDWENNVAIALLKLVQNNAELPLILEDEGRLIGRIHIPFLLQTCMRSAPKVLLECSLPERVLAIHRDYVHALWPVFLDHHGERAEIEFRKFFIVNLGRIRKRLGQERHDRILRLFETGLQAPFDIAHPALHDGITLLLQEYYDPLYAHLLSQAPGKILFRGEAAAVTAWLHEHTATGQ